MPRAANTKPAARPAGRDLPDEMVQRTVPANSVFQAAQQAAGKQRQNHQPPDISEIKVYDNRPLPNVTTGRGAISVYARIYEEILTAPGKSVDLTPQQAKSMISWSKKNGKKLATRALGPGLAARRLTMEPGAAGQGPAERMGRPAEPERAAFERWFSDAGQYPAAVERASSGYKLAAAQAAWTAWQACWPLARAAIYSAEQAQIEAPLKAEIERLSKDDATWRASQKARQPSLPGVSG